MTYLVIFMLPRGPLKCKQTSPLQYPYLDMNHHLIFRVYNICLMRTRFASEPVTWDPQILIIPSCPYSIL